MAAYSSHSFFSHKNSIYQSSPSSSSSWVWCLASEPAPPIIPSFIGILRIGCRRQSTFHACPTVVNKLSCWLFCVLLRLLCPARPGIQTTILYFFLCSVSSVTPAHHIYHYSQYTQQIYIQFALLSMNEPGLECDSNPGSFPFHFPFFHTPHNIQTPSNTPNMPT